MCIVQIIINYCRYNLGMQNDEIDRRYSIIADLLRYNRAHDAHYQSS